MSDWRDQLDQLERRRWLDGANVEVWAGRLLLLMTGLVVIASVPALHPSPHDWIVIAAVSSVMLLVLAGTFMVPWTAPPGIGSVLFPLAVIFGLAALGRLTSAAIGSCYLGIFVLCFAYVGVCCPRRTGWLLLLPAVPGYVLAADRWDAYIEIRLAVAVAIWIVLAEVLAALMRRQHQVTALLEHAARTDELTGVGNRRDLDQRIASSRPGDTLVICDLDHFKLVNDTLGHAAGDQILQTFGATLLGCLRGDDYAGRYGGEEFVLILADTDQDESRQVLERLRRKWSETGHATSFSAGYCTRLPDSAPAQAISAADLALYAAKAAGRDCALPAQVAHA